MAAEPPYRFAARGTSVGLLRWMAARSIWSMPPEHARRVLAGGASRHSGRVLAQRRAVAQHLRGRELHGGTGGCGEAAHSLREGCPLDRVLGGWTGSHPRMLFPPSSCNVGTRGELG